MFTPVCRRCFYVTAVVLSHFIHKSFENRRSSLVCPVPEPISGGREATISSSYSTTGGGFRPSFPAPQTHYVLITAQA